MVKQPLKAAARLTRRLAAAIILFVVLFTALYFIAVLIGGLISQDLSSAASDASGRADVQIFLYNNGRHYDIWLPAEYCGFLEAGNGWYGFGWGDRDFFLNTPRAGDVKPGLLLKALFLPSRSILAVQHSNISPGEWAASSAVETGVDAARRAADFIASSFQTGADGLLQPVPEELAHPSYSGYSFYEARGFYSCLFTSNSWVNRVLKRAGLSGGLWTPLTFGVGRGSFPTD